MSFTGARGNESLQYQRTSSRVFARLAALVLGALGGGVLGCSSSSDETPAPVVAVAPDAGPTADTGPVVNDDPACDPFTPRATAEQLVVGPTDLEKTIVSALSSAKTSIDLAVTELDRKAVMQALDAARSRGVALRIIVDRAKVADAKAVLGDAVVHETRADLVAHARIMVIDGKRALVGSFDLGSTSIDKERSFSSFVDDATDVAQLQKLIEHDWNATAGSPPLACTKLIVSPGSGRQQVVEQVETAEEKLDLELAEVTDEAVSAAIKARASAGVKVRVLLADPVVVASNKTSGAALSQAGAEVRYYRKLTLDASLVVTERAALVGSHLLSTASLDTQRDVSLLVANDAPREAAAAAFEADWAVGALQ